jgi:hypothetical protein
LIAELRETLAPPLGQFVLAFCDRDASHNQQKAWIDALIARHSPLRMHAAAHFRDASGPSRVRTISIIPLMISPEAVSAIPAGATLGQTSTHFPHRVQASSMSSTRAPSAVSKDISLIV